MYFLEQGDCRKFHCGPNTIFIYITGIGVVVARISRVSVDDSTSALEFVWNWYRCTPTSKEPSRAEISLPCAPTLGPHTSRY